MIEVICIAVTTIIGAAAIIFQVRKDRAFYAQNALVKWELSEHSRLTKLFHNAYERRDAKAMNALRAQMKTSFNRAGGEFYKLKELA